MRNIAPNCIYYPRFGVEISPNYIHSPRIEVQISPDFKTQTERKIRDGNQISVFGGRRKRKDL